MRFYRSTPLLARSLRPCSLGKTRSLRGATRQLLHKSDSGRLACSTLPCETGRFPSARSEHPASHLVVRSRNRPDSGAWLQKRRKLLSLARTRSPPVPASKLVRQLALLPSTCPS